MPKNDNGVLLTQQPAASLPDLNTPYHIAAGRFLGFAAYCVGWGNVEFLNRAARAVARELDDMTAKHNGDFRWEQWMTEAINTGRGPEGMQITKDLIFRQ
jgi:hypothetical protein